MLHSPLEYLLIFVTENMLLLSLFFTFEKHIFLLSLLPKRLEFYITNENSPYEFKSSKFRDAQNGRGLI